MTPEPRGSRLADAAGIYSMVAVDQRESLRAMLREGTQHPVADRELSEFKVDVARVLSPRASGILIDVDYGLDPIVDAGALAPTCPVIVAVDRITYSPEGATLSTAVRPELLSRSWAPEIAGLKLLLLWTPEGWIGCSSDDVRDYIEACADAGVDSVLEVVVRGADAQVAAPEVQAALLVEAARDLNSYRPTLYKTEVPFRAEASSAQVTATSARITEAMDCPWVVLSSGVPAERFPLAVRDTRAGGARGFLAGRAIWGAAARSAAAERDRLLTGPAMMALDTLVDAAHTGAAAR